MADSSAWLKQHAAGEKLLGRAISKYFADQATRVVTLIGDLGLSIDAAHKAIDVDHETALLQQAVATPLIGFMGTGAENVIKQARKPKSTKAFDSEALKNFTLPKWVQDEIERAFNDLEKQDYWAEIQKSTVDDVAAGVKYAIEQGYSMAKAAKYLEESFAFSHTRAAAISRTETTGCYNAGHDTSYRFLAESNSIAGVEWLGIADKNQRDSHAEADGQIIKVGELFSVGGESARYPGDPALSAANRVNCRCSTAGVFE